MKAKPSQALSEAQSSRVGGWLACWVVFAAAVNQLTLTTTDDEDRLIVCWSAAGYSGWQRCLLSRWTPPPPPPVDVRVIVLRRNECVSIIATD